jgi:hypothetical protein
VQSVVWVTRSLVAQICNLLVSSEIVPSRDDFYTAGARRSRRFTVQILQALFSFHSVWNFKQRSGVNAALL